RRIEALAWDGRAVRVDDARAVVPLTGPCAFGAAAFAHGEITTYLARGELPRRTAVTDPFRHASGAPAFALDLAPGGTRGGHLPIPCGRVAAEVAEEIVGTSGAAVFEAAVRDWRERLGTVALRLPPVARDHADTVRTAAAQILVNRDGPALQ